MAAGDSAREVTVKDAGGDLDGLNDTIRTDNVI